MMLKLQAICLVGMLFAAPLLADEPKPKPAQPTAPAANRAELEKKFSESMTGAAMIGHFTDSNRKSSDLTEEKYILEKVVKDQGDDWLFTVRIQYGKHNLPVTLKIPVVWAGDTPIISVTKLSVPLMGTFNARVVIYEGRYAGTWSGAGHGGHLFGRIEKRAAEPKLNQTDVPGTPKKSP